MVRITAGSLISMLSHGNKGVVSHVCVNADRQMASIVLWRNICASVLSSATLFFSDNHNLIWSSREVFVHTSAHRHVDE